MRNLWLYLHPITMAIAIAIGVAALREGLRLRDARLRGRKPGTLRHRRLGKLFVPLLAAGYAHGLIQIYFMRHAKPLESVHWILATAVLLTSLAAGCFGLALERGQALQRRSAHALLGGGSILLALGSGLAGMALLP